MTRSEVATSRRDGRPAHKVRAYLTKHVDDDLLPGETIVALLPFATVPKRPKGPEGKIRIGIRQSWRRYRPVVVTNRRLFVFDSGRTPHPRELIAAFPIEDVTLVEIHDGRFGQQVMVLDLPEQGPVPFELGKRDLGDLATVTAALDATT